MEEVAELCRLGGTTVKDFIADAQEGFFADTYLREAWLSYRDVIGPE